MLINLERSDSLKAKVSNHKGFFGGNAGSGAAEVKKQAIDRDKLLENMYSFYKE